MFHCHVHDHFFARGNSTNCCLCQALQAPAQGCLRINKHGGMGGMFWLPGDPSRIPSLQRLSMVRRKRCKALHRTMPQRSQNQMCTSKKTCLLSWFTGKWVPPKIIISFTRWFHWSMMFLLPGSKLWLHEIIVGFPSGFQSLNSPTPNVAGIMFRWYHYCICVKKYTYGTTVVT